MQTNSSPACSSGFLLYLSRGAPVTCLYICHLCWAVPKSEGRLLVTPLPLEPGTVPGVQEVNGLLSK